MQILPINVSNGDKTFCSDALLGSGSDKLNLCGRESSLTIANVISIKLKIKSKLLNLSSFICGTRNRNGEDVACYIRSAISYIQKQYFSEET